MKHFTLAMLAALTILSGCAATQQGQNTSPSTAAAAQRQAVPVPAASMKKVVLNINGPKNVVESKDWKSFKEEWRATFADHAKQAGIAFSMQDGPVKPTGETGTLLSVHVNDFRMVGIGSRAVFGVMTGNAFIDAKAHFLDLKTGRMFGSQTYNTTSNAWHGVFAKVTPQQVDTVASGVFAEFTPAR
jgi:hypothetical protein